MGGCYMGKHRKNREKAPRHKRLNRDGRLQAAPHWIPKYEGKSLVKGYSNHFEVDKICAVNELEMLGYSFSDEYKQKVKAVVLKKQKENKKRKAAKKQKDNDLFGEESDETFAFIAGYTSGGAPFGVTWKEWEHEEDNLVSTKETVPNIDDNDLPF